MNQSKNRFLVVSTAAALAAMLATASILSGCGGGEGEAKETRVVTETQIVTKVVNGVFTDEEGNIIKDADGNPMTAPAGTPDTDAKEKSESEAKESKSSGEKSEAAESKSDDGDNGSSKSDDSKESKSSESKESKSSKSSKSEGGGSGEVLKVGGESFSVGDEITCVYSVTCPDCFINYQATLNYDSSVLKATGAKMQGEASSGSVVNYKLDGKVKFNGISLAGYDYTEGDKFMYVTYEVIGSGSTSPEISWEIVTDEKNNPMVVNGDIKSSFKISESWE